MDLHRLVRLTADAHPDIADPGELADLVFKGIDPRDYAETIKLILRSYVRDVIRTERRSPAAEPARVPVETGQVPSTTFRPSPFVAGVRETWRRHLADRIHVGGGSWKFLRECLHEDLREAADERRRLAAENTASARLYEELAAALTLHRVNTVSDLPDEELRKILN